MAQDIHAGTFRYEVVIDSHGTPVQIQNMNLQMTQMRRRVQDADNVLERFLTRQKLGWGALGLTAGKVMKDIADGSSFLSGILGAPGTLANSLGIAVDLAFTEEMVAFQEWLAEAQGTIINIGADIGEAENKVNYISGLLGELAGKATKATIDLAINMPSFLDRLAGAGVDVGQGLTSGFLEGLGMPEDQAKIFGDLFGGPGGAIAAAFLVEKGAAKGLEKILPKALTPELPTAGGAAGRFLTGTVPKAAGRLTGILGLVDAATGFAGGYQDPATYLDPEVEQILGGRKNADAILTAFLGGADMIAESQGGDIPHTAHAELIRALNDAIKDPSSNRQMLQEADMALSAFKQSEGSVINNVTINNTFSGASSEYVDWVTRNQIKAITGGVGVSLP